MNTSAEMELQEQCGQCEQKSREFLKLLSGISSSILKEDEISSTLREVLELLKAHLGISRGTISIFNRKTGKISIEEGVGISPEEQARGVYNPGEGITGKVIESGMPAIIPDVAKEPEFLNRTGAVRDLGTEKFTFISVPIKAGKEIIGTLNADRKAGRDTSAEEVQMLLQITAAMISQAVQLYQAHHEENQFLIEENERLNRELEDKFSKAHIVGTSKVMRRVFDYVKKIADTTATVLILGESGTGKELVARKIHYASSRHNKPFVKLNCAALPESIIESELFGHEKGAFTGAVNMRKGRFELADGGTIFLDEIGELSLNVQTKLLRVLQEREFERVGGVETLKCNVRVITATNRNLEEDIRNGTFREDLYYRLNIIPVTVPPLRERKSDIPLLVNHFIAKFGELNNKNVRRISTPAIDMLFSYHWPGNIRELENCIEHAVILSEDEVIHGYHLPPTLQMRLPASSISEEKGALQQQIDALEYELIVEALKSADGNLSEAAKELGLTNRMIGIRAKKYNLDFRKFRSPKNTKM
ncbi:MAG: nif-specific transcriptional activator NifA [Spirochaetales bacterium]|uniref:Nif-specific regulatory protein n=1 Tax=Candidatus Thalassospirochaeta sargassi TaxID=3119039 RepID=A0AAJ1MPG1_9SPIO|nr:nif-specific transcriptional activator NifA [Spirochaetales bacterium]